MRTKEQLKKYKSDWDRKNREHNRIYKSNRRAQARLAKMMKAGTL